MKVPSGGKTLQWMSLKLLRWEHVRDIVIAAPVCRRSLQLCDLVIILHKHLCVPIALCGSPLVLVSLLQLWNLNWWLLVLLEPDYAM